MKIIYDRFARRFRYPEGTFASAAAVQYQTEKYQKDKQAELVALAKDLAANPNNVTLQKQVAATLKEIHISAASLAAGGHQNLYANDYLILARGLKRQYGLTDNEKPYGLSFLYKDIDSGYTTESQLVNRLKMYANSAKTAYNEIEKSKKIDKGFTQAKRVLGTAEHCPECITYSNFGWVGINDIILPTMQCSCLTNCNCKIVYK